MIRNYIEKIVLNLLKDLVELLAEPNELGKNYYVINKSTLDNWRFQVNLFNKTEDKKEEQ